MTVSSSVVCFEEYNKQSFKKFNGKSLISVFPEFFASINKVFILAGRLGA